MFRPHTEPAGAAVQAHDQRDGSANRRAARRLLQATRVLAVAVLTDSALEHYRAGFKRKAMFAAPTLAGLSLAATSGGIDELGRPSRSRPAAFVLALAGGMAGTVFHIRNLARRAGGLRWQSLFYGAPFGAPAALSLTGALGLAALALNRQARRAPLPGASSSRWSKPIGLLVIGGLFGTIGEVALFHFRGAFHNRFMFLPLAIPPVAAAGLALATMSPNPARVRTARGLLATTALLGGAGMGFHAYGVSRNMGGWGNWRQTVLQGPPLPAPLAFTGLALAGFGALALVGRSGR